MAGEIEHTRGTGVGAVAALAGMALLLGGCNPGPGADQPLTADTAAVPEAGGRDSLRPGLRFDPATLLVGQQVGAVLVDSLAVTTAFGDSTRVGTVRFRGELTLEGTTVLHFDADARDATRCFEVDAASAATMPRWQGDERRPWFCFDNVSDAARILGPPREGSAATIVIDRFTIHRGFSDQVNTAHLISGVPDSSTTERP